MKAAVNIVLFGSLAVALHLAVFALRAQDGSAQFSGDGGEDLVAIAAAPESYADMVEQWETPPELSEAPPPDLAAPEAPDLAPPLAETAAPTSPEMPQLPQIAAAAPDLPQLPQLDDAPPPPPELPKPEPEAQPEPKPEPKPEPEPEPEPEPQLKPEAVKKPEPQKAPPKPQPQAVQSAPSAQQTAAGSGGGKQAGEGQDAQVATLSKSQRQTLVVQWGATIRTRIDRVKRLPRGAASGRVTVVVSVGADGSLRGVSLFRSSGNSALDAAAIAAVKRARKFRPAPKGLPDKTFNFRLPIEFR